jgi:hypothetical protein
VKTESNNKSKIEVFTSETQEEVAPSDYSKIAPSIVGAYRQGSRNDIVFRLSGFLCHHNLTLKSIESIVRELCDLTNDEEVSNRILVVQNTYEKAVSGNLVTGYTALFETLERIVGTDTANQIIRDINYELNKNQNQVLPQLNQCIRDELSGHVFEPICYDPLTLIVAHAVKKQI